MCPAHSVHTSCARLHGAASVLPALAWPGHSLSPASIPALPPGCNRKDQQDSIGRMLPESESAELVWHSRRALLLFQPPQWVLQLQPIPRWLVSQRSAGGSTALRPHAPGRLLEYSKLNRHPTQRSCHGYQHVPLWEAWPRFHRAPLPAYCAAGHSWLHQHCALPQVPATIYDLLFR